MGLRIANNISAMTTHRWLGVSDNGLTRSLERLSSGYRINRAADDAAGLAISQSFRADIASFKVASRNTSEASALLQVAEGGMDQIANMLTRLKELATQASSANAGQSERDKIDAEGDALLSEINRIANVTMYGSSALLDGTFGAAKDAGTYTYSSGGSAKIYGDMTHVYSGNFSTASLMIANFSGITSLDSTKAYSGTWEMTATDAGTTVWLGNGSVTESITITAMSTVSAVTKTLSFTNLGITMNMWAVSTVGTASGIGLASEIDIRETGLTSLNVVNAASGTFTFSAANPTEVALGNGSITQTITGLTIGTTNTLNFDKLGVTFILGTKYTEDDLENINFVVTATGGTGSTFQIGAENNTNNQIAISVDGVTRADLNLTNLDLSTADNARLALDLVDSAISTLAGSRGNIGAYMNRLSYAAANLATTIENVQAAESVIRDVDMAAEMTEFTKNQILLQAGTAMLAQANMAPQQVLALFG